MTLAPLRRSILRWYRRAARDLPWRRTKDPYAILVSEVMLQQTQVVRVIPKYRSFLKRFPTLASLARAPLADVLREWSGLGYNGRARRLWECARSAVAQHGGKLPRDAATLASLPGIGRYTAGAIASFAFGARAAAVDTNVRRVLGRAIDGVDDVGDRRAWELAELALPNGAAGEWNQAVMDVGALFCRPIPKCAACPARGVCRGRSLARPERARTRPVQPRFDGSRRFFRGRIVAALAIAPALSLLELGEQVKDGFGKTDLPWLEDLLTSLQRDGLVAVDRARRNVRLP
jgi:A/G-specific adenine glycosylase